MRDQSSTYCTALISIIFACASRFKAGSKDCALIKAMRTSLIQQTRLTFRLNRLIPLSDAAGGRQSALTHAAAIAQLWLPPVGLPLAAEFSSIQLNTLPVRAHHACFDLLRAAPGTPQSSHMQHSRLQFIKFTNRPRMMCNRQLLG